MSGPRDGREPETVDPPDHEQPDNTRQARQARRRGPMLMRFDPFRDFDSLAQMLSERSGPSRPSPIPMDAYRDGDRFVIHFDLPGVDPSSIDLTVEKNVLTVRAERAWPASEGQE